MDKATYDNWKKIRDLMEKSGNTKNQFYSRACEIMKTGKDPFENTFYNKK